MALEPSVTFINDLNPLNPTDGDLAKDGDNHIRLIKGAIKNTFPNINAAVTVTAAVLNLLTGLEASGADLNKLKATTATAAEINRLSGVTSNIQTQLNALSALISSSAAVVPGTIIAWAGPTGTIPAGYGLCDGGAISRSANAATFANIGTTYGSGDGSTTFNKPDLRGVFLRGLDNGRGLDSGRTLGTYQADAFASHIHSAWTDTQGQHNHYVNDPGHVHNLSQSIRTNTSGSFTSSATNTNGSSGIITATSSHTGIWLNDSGAHSHNVGIGAAGSGNDTRPKNVAVNYIIKLG